MPKTDVYDRVTAQIITALEAGTIPWRKPWDPRIGRPLSLSTRKPYRGINLFLLGLIMQERGYRSPFFGTYKKIAELGGQVRKGEKSSLITFWKTGSTERENPETGDPETKRWAILRSYLVFNAEQADGLPERFMTAPAATANVPLLECANVVADYFNMDGAPELVHGGSHAAYSPTFDRVMMPLWEAFNSAEGYYSTIFHEMTHSTGHKSRLARPGAIENHRFGDEVYAGEELVAEMGSAMLAGVTGIEQATLDRSAAYIDNWLSALRGDSKLVVQAAGQAQRAVDLILDTKFDTDDETEG